jgi:predicted RNase H-like nuclease (RuvC/YqgF family)
MNYYHLPELINKREKKLHKVESELNEKKAKIQNNLIDGKELEKNLEVLEKEMIQRKSHLEYLKEKLENFEKNQKLKLEFEKLKLEFKCGDKVDYLTARKIIKVGGWIHYWSKSTRNEEYHLYEYYIKDGKFHYIKTPIECNQISHKEVFDKYIEENIDKEIYDISHHPDNYYRIYSM